MSQDAQRTVLEVFHESLGIEVPSPDMDLIDSGLLDSLGLVTLVFELEQRCAVSIRFETLSIDAFRTVESIAQVLEGAR